jgi:hypothetical protein
MAIYRGGSYIPALPSSDTRDQPVCWQNNEPLNVLKECAIAGIKKIEIPEYLFSI